MTGISHVEATSREMITWGTAFAISALLAAYFVVAFPTAKAAADAAIRARLMADHTAVCDRLGHADGTGQHSTCMTELMQLKERHEKTFYADSAGLL